MSEIHGEDMAVMAGDIDRMEKRVKALICERDKQSAEADRLAVKCDRLEEERDRLKAEHAEMRGLLLTIVSDETATLSDAAWDRIEAIIASTVYSRLIILPSPSTNSKPS